MCGVVSDGYLAEYVLLEIAEIFAHGDQGVRVLMS